MPPGGWVHGCRKGRGSVGKDERARKNFHFYYEEIISFFFRRGSERSFSFLFLFLYVVKVILLFFISLIKWRGRERKSLNLIGRVN